MISVKRDLLSIQKTFQSCAIMQLFEWKVLSMRFLCVRIKELLALLNYRINVGVYSTLYIMPSNYYHNSKTRIRGQESNMSEL